MGIRDVDAPSVRAAIAECRRMGRAQFLAKYGFIGARRYELIADGERFDSKAILNVAHLHATGKLPHPLFSGGVVATVRPLRRLGFEIQERDEVTASSAGRTRVIVAPAGGAGRKHWQDTMHNPVLLGEYSSYMSTAEHELLARSADDGEVRLWGAVASFSDDVSAATHGDLVIFTADGMATHVGVFGWSVRNESLATQLWTPGEGGVFVNVFTIEDLNPLAGIDYAELNKILGYSPRYAFPGTRFFDHGKSQLLIDALGLDSSIEPSESLEEALARAVFRAAGKLGVVGGEALKVEESSYHRPSGRVVFRRDEALLVRSYLAFLGHSEDYHRLSTKTGFSDAYLVDGGEVLEAKKSSTHVAVRHALAQLLDYALFAGDVSVERLTALFPAPPDDHGIDLLHAHGIDCVFLDGHEFHRLEAGETARRRTLSITVDQLIEPLELT